MSFVYLLECTDNATYVGATINLEKRLRQHRGEIKGGAKATTRKIKEGKTWERVCYVSGFPTWQSALQFEWRWKHLSRRISNKSPLERRLLALQRLLGLSQSTSKALPFAEWEQEPVIHFEEEKMHVLFQELFPFNLTKIETHFFSQMVD